MQAAEEAAANERHAERLAYLAATGWADAKVEPLGSDASIRQYFRLVGGPAPALLMDAPSAATEPPCPPGASPDERRRLGYGALVRGSGSSLKAYHAASKLLEGCGVLVPHVLDADYEAGFAIVQDLGADHVADAARRPGGEAKLYEDAADILDLLRFRETGAGEHHGWPLQEYDTLALETEAALLCEWYLPRRLGIEPSPEDEARLTDAWRSVLGQLSRPRHLVHRDFHADNLMVCGPRIGVLDFQDLMIGQAAYDWASLIEDARRDVAPAVRDRIYARGVDGSDDPVAFERDYAILAAQRNAKILGLFARLAFRDGKRRYLDLMPRVRRFFTGDLARAPLEPVRAAIADLAPELLKTDV